jgi:hypothetical protein
MAPLAPHSFENTASGSTEIHGQAKPSGAGYSVLRKTYVERWCEPLARMGPRGHVQTEPVTGVPESFRYCFIHFQRATCSEGSSLYSQLAYTMSK